ncbi:MAG: bifunctional folylpolyglutamate synthase/dihydrofolate synthase [Spirochaetales bacterium]|nr:bifunctional folylpolyglutamate synthase/dihydrofolate synthase [Spirochaetales bacterium]
MSSGKFGSSEDIYDFLSGYINVEKGQATVFKLDRMRALASALGNPEKGRLCIHVAGSKGKGSISTMSARILSEAGLKVGIYTSPHILRWKERIALADGEMPEDALITAANEVVDLVDGLGPERFPGGELPTFFELSTLIAFCAFKNTACDAQVIEVGLGGRLDSTNIVEPDVSVISTIELEHTQFLGNSLAEIAFEKAGIMKPGKPVCISRQNPEAMAVFDKRARELGCPVLKLGTHVRSLDIEVDARGTRCRIACPPDSPSALKNIVPRQGLEVETGIIGEIQGQNMALAALACAAALPRLEARAITGGLKKARIPARFELVSTQPPIVLDGAHTPESVQRCLDTVKRLFPGPRILLFACAQDKRHQEMAFLLAPYFDTIIVTKPGSFKASDPDSVHSSFLRTGRAAILEGDTAAALEGAVKAAKELKAMLLVAGSFYLCAEAKLWLAAHPLNNE